MALGSVANGFTAPTASPMKFMYSTADVPGHWHEGSLETFVNGLPMMPLFVIFMITLPTFRTEPAPKMSGIASGFAPRRPEVLAWARACTSCSYARKASYSKPSRPATPAATHGAATDIAHPRHSTAPPHSARKPTHRSVPPVRSDHRPFAPPERVLPVLTTLRSFPYSVEYLSVYVPRPCSSTNRNSRWRLFTRTTWASGSASNGSGMSPSYT